MIDKESLKAISNLGIEIDHKMAFGGKSKGNKHLFRVVKLAKYLAKKENADVNIVEAAAWLHDTALPSGNDYDYIKNKKIALKLLKDIRIDKSDKDLVAECIASHEGTAERNTLEAKIVHDADVLEKTGILGLIRHTWKLTNFQKINPENITEKDVNEIKEHIVWRINQLETKEAKKLVKKFVFSMPKKNEIETIKSISKMASQGVITEKIANKIMPKLSEKNKKLLNTQLKQEYLK